MSKTIAKSGLNLAKKCLLLQLFRTQMYLLALNCYHWDKGDNGVMYPAGSPNIKVAGVPVGNFIVNQGQISPDKFLVPCLSVRVKFTNQ